MLFTTIPNTSVSKYFINKHSFLILHKILLKKSLLKILYRFCLFAKMANIFLTYQHQLNNPRAKTNAIISSNSK